jgi:hypothetical protein
LRGEIQIDVSNRVSRLDVTNPREIGIRTRRDGGSVTVIGSTGRLGSKSL